MKQTKAEGLRALDVPTTKEAKQRLKHLSMKFKKIRDWLKFYKQMTDG